jgi:hypothetical protein
MGREERRANRNVSSLRSAAQRSRISIRANDARADVARDFACALSGASMTLMTLYDTAMTLFSAIASSPENVAAHTFPLQSTTLNDAIVCFSGIFRTPARRQASYGKTLKKRHKRHTQWSSNVPNQRKSPNTARTLSTSNAYGSHFDPRIASRRSNQSSQAAEGAYLEVSVPIRTTDLGIRKPRLASNAERKRNRIDLRPAISGAFARVLLCREARSRDRLQGRYRTVGVATDKRKLSVARVNFAGGGEP